MHPALKTLHVLGYVLKVIAIILLIPVLIVVLLVYILITLPYTLFYFSSNWSMRHKYHSAVETYLSYFEHLHPNLIAYVSACHTALAETNHEPAGVRQWPHRTKRMFICIPFIGSLTETTYHFSNAAGLFAKMEASGWRRQLLWTFLRDQVEQTGWPTTEQRNAFAQAMQVMNSHNILDPTVIRQWFTGDDNGADAEKERRAEERLAGVGLPIVHVRDDSLDWLLQPGVLLVPNDKTRAMMIKLSTYAPIWGPLPKQPDLEKGPLDGRWQVVDTRSVYPWTDK